MEAPKIGIHMCTYNHGKYIADAIDSVRRQTYQNWELFIVNDGSTDQTSEILSQYGDERIRYYEFIENTGHAGAGIYVHNWLKQYDFDYIANLDSDDIWREDKLQKQVDYLMDHPEYKACFTWDKIIYEKDNDGNYRNNESYSHKKNRSRFDWIMEFFVNGNCLNACSMVMETDLFYDLGCLNQYYYHMADFRLWLRLALKAPFYLMEEELTFYRRHGTNTSNITIESAVRCANEQYALFGEIMELMDQAVFKRSFYSLMPYVECNTKEEFLAETFLLLFTSDSVPMNQLALDIYFKNCSNADFISVLEKKYFFRQGYFKNITGNSGMAFLMNSLTMSEIIPQKKEKLCTPADVLLDHINADKLDEAFVKEAAYSTLFDFYNITGEVEGGIEKFNLIKEEIAEIRRKIHNTGRGLKRLFMMAEHTLCRAGTLIEELGIGCEDECMVACIRTVKSCFDDSGGRRRPEAPEAVRQLDLYNSAEHCHYFLHELGESADVIYFVDCLGSRFDVGNMLAGYALAVEANCVLCQEEYDEMAGSDNRLLSMMHQIMVYQ